MFCEIGDLWRLNYSKLIQNWSEWPNWSFNLISLRNIRGLTFLFCRKIERTFLGSTVHSTGSRNISNCCLWRSRNHGLIFGQLPENSRAENILVNIHSASYCTFSGYIPHYHTCISLLSKTTAKRQQFFARMLCLCAKIDELLV